MDGKTLQAVWESIRDFLIQYPIWVFVDWIRDTPTGRTFAAFLGTAIMTFLGAHWKKVSAETRLQFRGAFIASVTAVILVAVWSLTARLLRTTDPRMVPDDKVTAFLAALGPPDANETVFVGCEDPSGCILASRYRDWFSDHWRLGPLSKCTLLFVGTLTNRVWIIKHSEAPEPKGAVTLHAALRDVAGMDPGYRVQPCLQANEFVFMVGARNENSN